MGALLNTVMYNLRPIRDPQLKYWSQLPDDLLAMVFEHYTLHTLPGSSPRYNLRTRTPSDKRRRP